MSGVTVAGTSGRETRRFVSDPLPRRDFGRRVVARKPVASDNVDCGVAAMRRRIDYDHAAVVRRLAWAVASVAIGGTAMALWLDVSWAAHALTQGVAQLF